MNINLIINYLNKEIFNIKMYSSEFISRLSSDLMSIGRIDIVIE